MEIKKFDVIGMTCASCVAHVEKSVNKLDGVQAVNVQLLTNSMTVTFDDKQLDIQAIEDSVKKAGYKANLNTLSVSDTVNKKEHIDIGKTETEALWRRFWMSAVCLLPLLYVSMGHMLRVPLPEFLSGSANMMSFAFTQFLLTIPIVLVNKRFYSNGFRSLFQGSPTMDTLIAIGSGAALAYGVYALYGMSYAYGHGNMDQVLRYAHDLYFESAATILTLITLGKYLEARSKLNTTNSLSKLLDLAPKTALISRNGNETEVPVEQVSLGDVVVLKPGKSVPVDGIVLSGNSSVDESALTGESVPVLKQPGDRILSASINQSGFLTFKATKVGADTTVAQIIHLVEEAAASKAPISKMADQISRIFVPTVIVIAFLATVVWLLMGYPLEFSLSIGIAVLVISCPCALGLATPVAIMVGTGKGAEHGVLFKSAEALETAHKVTVVVLDKTGTLTAGKPRVTDVLPLEGLSGDDLLQLCASLEIKSEHPLATAILDAAFGKNISLLSVEQFASITGEGIEGVVGGKTCLVGNRNFMLNNGRLSNDTIESMTATLASQGKTPLFVAGQERILGIIAVADVLKPGSREAVSQLKAMGLEVHMLTGDNVGTAEAIRKEAGIDHVLADVLPHEKDRKIAALQAEGYVVAMVGDGINDAPALTRADIGIAIGAGSDIALESADVVLMRNDLNDVVTALRLSRSVIQNIKQNLFWAFFYNILGIPLAAGVFFLAFDLKLNPMFAAAAMSLSSVTVVLNALRLKRFSPEQRHIQLVKPLINNKRMKTKTIHIEGMSCGHCSASVEKALNGIDGVSASVSLSEKKATVTVEGIVGDEILKQAVTGAGYEVTGIE